MKGLRALDLSLALILFVILFPVMIIIFFVGAICFEGKPIFVQPRVGRHKKTFDLYKFRTLPLETPDVPTHMLSEGKISFFGVVLRKLKLDELPQLVNVLVGDMSIVGPRPCLLAQAYLIGVRDEVGIYDFKPGITGLAQMHGVDMSQPEELVRLDKEMMKEFGFGSYFSIIFLTPINIMNRLSGKK